MSKPRQGISLTRNVAHDLTKTIKLLSTRMPKYVERLEELMESKDEKIAYQATVALMDYYKDSVAERDKSELQKLVIKMKVGMLAAPPSVQNNVPMVDFSTIQNCE